MCHLPPKKTITTTLKPFYCSMQNKFCDSLYIFNALSPLEHPPPPRTHTPCLLQVSDSIITNILFSGSWKPCFVLVLFVSTLYIYLNKYHPVKQTIPKNVTRTGVYLGGSWGCPGTPPPLVSTNLTIQVEKKFECEESTCHKSFLVLDSYILNFQDQAYAVDHVSTLDVT